jgi:hypothetical protein
MSLPARKRTTDRKQVREAARQESSKHLLAKSNVANARGPVTGLKLAPIHETNAWIELVEAKPYALDLGMSLHTPNSLRSLERGWDDRWLQLTLTKFFAALDRKTFGGASCRRHTNRLVVLQRADGVGWHAHVQIATPKRFTQVEFAELAKGVWLNVLHGHTSGPFGKQLFWCEPVDASHMPYMLRGLHINTVDEENTRLS